eukprot:TRINITY_DN6085_c0_g1_i2.p2 TRINITY_DN6085_c0_g1~~TRINITY_DN6085_c0_g1_i2.p2  ORF type:complete len:394 (-),score=78.90 TRINITY_DN6085_c0_g1_i2:1535-2716(-)
MELKFPTMPLLRGNGTSPRISSGRRVVSMNDLDEKSLYIKKKRNRTENYVIDNILGTEMHYSSDIRLVPFIIWSCLIEWDHINGIIPRMIHALNNDYKELPAENLFSWFSTNILLLHMAYDESEKFSLDNEQVQNIELLQEILETNIIKFSELILQDITENIRKLFVPVIRKYLYKKIKVSSVVYNELKEQLKIYITLAKNHAIVTSIEKYMISEIWKIFNDIGVEALIEGPTSYGKGLSIKMNVLSPIEEYIEITFDRNDVRYMEKFRQAVNVLCWPMKSDLTDTNIHQSIWPNLEPEKIVQVLEKYRPDIDDPDGIPNGLLENIIKLESVEISVPKLEIKKEEFLSNFQCMSFDEVAIPKAIIKAPGLSFIRCSKSGMASASSDETESESW